MMTVTDFKLKKDLDFSVCAEVEITINAPESDKEIADLVSGIVQKLNEDDAMNALSISSDGWFEIVEAVVNALKVEEATID
jgi:putative lipoic acid-binding regulatory protein